MLKRSCALALLIMSPSAAVLAQAEPGAAATPSPTVTASPSVTTGANPFKRSAPVTSGLPPPPPVAGAVPGAAITTGASSTTAPGAPPAYGAPEIPQVPTKGRRIGKVGDEIIYRKDGIYSFETETPPGGLMPAPALAGAGTVIAPVVAGPGVVVQGSAGPQPVASSASSTTDGRVNVDPAGPKPVVPQ